MQLTVFFDDPYWVGLIELEQNGRLRVVRHLFGAEPGGAEVLAFVQHELAGLLTLADAALLDQLPPALSGQRRVSPKRLQREAARSLAQHGVSTAAQEAMRIQVEAGKVARRVAGRAEREAEAERRWLVSRQKARARHKGR